MKIEGVRYLPRLLQQCELYLTLVEGKDYVRLGSPLPKDRQTNDLYTYYLHMLNHDNTKRLLFDAHQALVFDQMNGLSLKAIKERKIIPPFRMHYLEFTEPVLLQAQEPNEKDLARGYLFAQAVVELPYRTGTGEHKKESVNQVTLFFTSQNNDSLVERSWLMTDDGRALIKKEHAAGYSFVGQPDIVEQREKNWSGSISEFPEWLQAHEYVVAGTHFDDMPNRVVGWWEQAMMSYTRLVFWIWAYTMAKSVHIEEVPLTRQLRRFHARHPERPYPKPWHIVRIRPKFRQGEQQNQGQAREHGYRYDVIAHLRFNRHKRKDGSYVDTIEVVHDHQRGLKYDLYIPKTGLVEADKEIALKEMKEYLG